MSHNKTNPPTNPHANAAGAYDQHAQAHTPDQREVEARVLLKAAKAFQNLQETWDDLTPERLDDVITYNRQIWMMFVDTAVEDDNPDRSVDLRNNIANLGVFIFKHSVDVLAAPAKEKLNILIEINQEIAAGLLTKPKDEIKAEMDGQDPPPPHSPMQNKTA